MKRFLIMFMALGLIAGSMATAQAEQGFESTQRTVEASYYGPQMLDQFGFCASSGEAGCVTLETFAHERSLTAKVTDAHGQPLIVRVVDKSDGHKLYGTFCGETTEPIYFTPDADVELWMGDGWWPRWFLVPVGCYGGYATTGTVSVTISGWTPSEEPPSPTPVESPAPQSSPSGQTAVVERSVDLVLRRHLRAFGSVVAADESCRSGVPVVIQRKRTDAWLDIGSTTTDADGAFALRLSDRPGRYRAIASEVGTAESTCVVARSATVRHQHER